MILYLFAFLSGIATLLSPCVLPLLPIILSGSVRGGRARPLGIVAGFALGFGILSLILSAAIQTLGLGANVLRLAALIIFFAFGLVLLVPALSLRFELASTAIIGRLGPERRPSTGQVAFGADAAIKPPAGFWSGVIVGLSLGIVWTPCVGPIMGSVIGLAATRRLDGGAVIIILAYTIGTSIAMFAVMLGGKALAAKIPALARRAAGIQRLFGVILILVAVAMAFGLDRRFEAWVIATFPKYGSGLTAIESSQSAQSALASRKAKAVSGPGAMTGPTSASANSGFAGIADPQGNGVLSDYGIAPELIPGGSWLGSPALTMASLRGKVVLVDFWTYSCVNCLRTLPYLKSWYSTYKDSGLVVIGVHSPEFGFEKDAGNVTKAMKELGVTWPVMQDNDYATWYAYSNQYWPAHYFIDAKGKVRYAHYGEGGYADSERVIRSLLAEAGAVAPAGAAKAGAVAVVAAPAFSTDETPETYLGYQRGKTLVTATKPVADTVVDYKTSRDLVDGEWSLSGKWKISGEYIESEGPGDPAGGAAAAPALELGFRANKVFLVLEGVEPGASLTVFADGKKASDGSDVSRGVVEPSGSRLYTLVTGASSGALHRLRLEARGKLKLYVFTFG